MRGVKLVNLTPHPVRVFLDGGKVETLPPSGDVLRVEEEVLETVDVGGGIVIVTKRTSGRLSLDPPQKKGVVYVVSFPVVAACGRDDFIIPDDLIRDEEGIVMGCRRFARFSIPRNPTLH